MDVAVAGVYSGMGLPLILEKTETMVESVHAIQSQYDSLRSGALILADCENLEKSCSDSGYQIDNSTEGLTLKVTVDLSYSGSEFFSFNESNELAALPVIGVAASENADGGSFQLCKDIDTASLFITVNCCAVDKKAEKSDVKTYCACGSPVIRSGRFIRILTQNYRI